MLFRSAEFSSYSNNAFSLNVSTEKKGILVLSEIYFPHWNAYIDGIPAKVYRADWSLRAIVVEAGNHTIEMKFEPTPFYSGMKISLATLFLCIAIGGFDFFRKRKTRLIQTQETETQSEQ